MSRTTYPPDGISVYEVGPHRAGSVLYRIVRGPNSEDPALLDSLRSHYELAMPPRRYEQRSAAIHMGLSMYTKLETARETARRFRRIGGWIAEVRLEPNRGINFARTGHPGHITVWARPRELVDLIGGIYAVDEK